MTQNLATTWVWRSNEDSREKGLVSVLAVAETLACVTLYWVLFLWLGVTWHHWLIVMAAPLVLLRSEQSVALGVKWIRAYNYKGGIPLLSASACLGFGLAFIVPALVTWHFAGYWFSDSTGLVFFAKTLVWSMLCVFLGGALSTFVAPSLGLHGTLIGAASGAFILALAVSGWAAAIVILLIPVYVFGMLFGTGLAAGLVMRAAAVRFFATARYLWDGLQSLPVNFRNAMIVADSFSPVELVPGDKDMTLGGEGTLLSKIRTTDDNSLPAFFRVMIMITVTIAFLPPLIWRWAIKSTAWFYIPLLWVRRGWLTHTGEDLRDWAQSYSSRKKNWLWLLVAFLSFVAWAVALFNLENWLALKRTTSNVGAPMGLPGFLSSLNWADLLTQPWMWFYIPACALTFYLFFALDDIAADIRFGATPDSCLPRIARLKWAANARAVVTNIGLALALWYFLGAVGAWQEVQGFMSHWL